ncbi:uncharacterized protein LOC120251562 [Dioscorea cayenensis subsp. rotundata]|uniref:Uncharacterized protein LOC120251562 n=1 Tax=Dioscorea cayennensis subsp. rotundata TaxID=55577 RepID=A0AB40AMN6_DIOCR|nr:uncharacterized protein LOC120251562 [Dioscorea cayenensis subsp. rotundata]
MRLLSTAAIPFSLPAIPRSRPSPPFPQIHSFLSPSLLLSIRPRPQLRRSFPPLSMATQPHSEPMNLLFVEMGVGYDQHGQDITAAAMRACKDAISSNSIPAFRRGSIPGVNSDQMKLQIKLGVPRSAQPFLDVERVKSVFPYGKILSFEVVDGGMICSSGVCLEAMGDKNDDCYIVNAAVYVGY